MIVNLIRQDVQHVTFHALSVVMNGGCQELVQDVPNGKEHEKVK
jgi:hypothetical protein